MWIISFLSCFILFSIFFYLITEEKLSDVLGLGFCMAIFVFIVFWIGYLCRNTDNADYELIYENNVYCHLTDINYTENRQIKIEAYRFPRRVEDKFSGHTYYRIDVETHNAPLKSYWIDSDKLEIVVSDKMIPQFKKLKYRLDRNRPKIYNYFLPKVLMYDTVSEVEGILYLPKEPIYIYGRVPEFLEMNFLEFIQMKI